MASAIARYVNLKWFYSTPMGVLNLISIVTSPFLGYSILQIPKVSARLDERERLQHEQFIALIDRGVIRVLDSESSDRP